MPRGISIYDDANLQRQLWTPATDLKSVAVWYDTSRLESLTLVSSAVSQLNDLSGNGRHLVQATAANRPVWSQTGWDGTKPCIYTQDDGDILTCTSTYYPTNFSAFAVVERFAQSSTSSTSIRPIFITKTDSTDPLNMYDRMMAVPRTGTPSQTVDSFIAAGATLNNNSCSVVIPIYQDKKYVIAGRFPSTPYTDTYAYLNGYTGSTITVNHDTNAGIDRLQLMGQSNNTVRTFLGKLGEFIIITPVASQKLRFIVEGYLAWKWKIKDMMPNHPFINRPPMIGD